MSINIQTALSANVTVPYGQLDGFLEWCKRNCADEWKFEESEEDTRAGAVYDFYFESERDYVAFLVWKK